MLSFPIHTLNIDDINLKSIFGRKKRFTVSDIFSMHNAYTSHMCVCVNFYKIYEFGLENSKKYEELYVTVVAFYHVLLFSNLLTFCFQKKRKRKGKIRKIIY